MGICYTVIIINENWGMPMSRNGIVITYSADEAETDLKKLYDKAKIIGKTQCMLIAEIGKNNAEEIYHHVDCDIIYEISDTSACRIDLVEYIPADSIQSSP